ncbi:flagellar biosynthesis anti-sigma factor FlgM [Hathewaya limosa]|uniref:Negative regulator of flagellin synthesis FlgM n=1 Tax=Hathewaya limosa TaxID=1536 RepID=A0ABU0JQ59_HATLI|nr:flagellar biosynthesis anti-sigma factor FlgM [Hathewaya limosa]MDQ0479225.1 negative regulator of flagellin synthesis FlgM [Hathewaya limosa]
MKINNVSINKVINIYDNKKQKIESKISKENKDKIEISNLGKKLSSLNCDILQKNSDKRVEEIRKEVQQGTYNRDSKLIAKKLIDVIRNRDI